MTRVTPILILIPREVELNDKVLEVVLHATEGHPLLAVRDEVGAVVVELPWPVPVLRTMHNGA